MLASTTREPSTLHSRTRAAEDPEAIEYNKRAVAPENPSQILGVRLVETFEL